MTVVSHSAFLLCESVIMYQNLFVIIFLHFWLAVLHSHLITLNVTFSSFLFLSFAVLKVVQLINFSFKVLAESI